MTEIIKAVESRRFWKMGFVWLAIIMLGADSIYKVMNGINYQNREACALYKNMPRWLFLFMEYFVELVFIVVIGVFIATLIEKYFLRFKRFFPSNPFTAFLYASLIPVCSCSAIPLIESMRKKLPMRTVITFVMAAPLLNPYIISLSFSILGPVYGTARILSSFALAFGAGMAAELAYKWMKEPEIGIYSSCDPKSCAPGSSELYEKTWTVFKRILPYTLMAGALGLGFELLKPVGILENIDFTGGWKSLILIIIIGVPLYFCNGGDVLFLEPLLEYTDMSMGTAIAFSLTSTAVCTTSLVMMTRFLGRKLTIVILSATVVMTIISAFIVNLFI